ncbi:MAG: hypothetical protein HY954_13425 [Deltaproteobacteria bacterium]|nr:hypothetical protein [Deltaproteobacteria bacterium]
MMLRYFKKQYAPAWLNHLLFASGVFSTMLGLTVIVGWYTHNIVFLKVLPSFEAMRYNTALGFFLSGTGLLSAYFNRKYLSRTCGVIVAAAAFLTLTEYIFGIDMGIDQFLMKDTVSASYPGRMAPSTALGFAFTGASLFFMYGPAGRQFPIVLGLFGSIVCSLGITALFGYLTGIVAFIAWGEFISMAAHASAGFTALGAGIIAFAWREEMADDMGALQWLPAIMGVCVVTGTLMLWRVSVAQEHSHIERTVQLKTNVVKDHVQDQTESRVLALVRMANRWEVHGKPARAEWESDAGLYLNHYTCLNSIRWIDPSFHTQWVLPEGTEDGLDSKFGLESDLYNGLVGARDRREVTISRPFSLGDGTRAVTASVPIFHGKDFQGFITCTFGLKEFFDLVLNPEIRDRYSVAVFNGDDELYRRSENTFEGGRWAQETGVSLYGANWRVRVWPNKELLAGLKSPLPKVVLFTGLVTSLLLTLVVWLAQTAQKRATAAEAANLALGLEVAERKRAEAEAQRHAGELEYEVTERKRAEEEVVKKAAELERSNAELGHFAYVASHDLQEPLRIIAGYLQLLARRYKGKLDSSADEFISFAVDGSKRMQRMINDLLTYSKVGRVNNFTHVDCAGLFDRTVPYLRASIDESGAVVTRDRLPAVFAVETQLEHLFHNLIGNAIKYRRGGIQPRIHVSAERKGNEWFFSFSDNGIGIDPEHSERIFVMFERLHGKDEYSGTGIGLAICKKVVNNHGGRIWVESQPRMGSTFYFTIPLQRG